jgi:tRNA(Arg) A34 adenosine deaminase TadA
MTDSFMSQAIAMSIANVTRDSGGPFAALVVKDGEIVGSGVNQVTSTNDPTAHAEIVAIREACRRLQSFQLSDCDVYTTCEPCPMCLGAIYWARPQRVFFANTRADARDIGFDDDFIYREIALPVDRRSIPMIRVQDDRALEAFRLWRQKPDKIRY